MRRLIHSLLVRIGRHHPQALMYPLLVACKSQSPARRQAAMAVVDNVRQHSATLVEQAQLVSQELIRMAILWHEMWHEALEEASRLYFGESNVEGMLSTLLPLHEMMRKQGPTTLKEIAFVQVGPSPGRSPSSFRCYAFVPLVFGGGEGGGAGVWRRRTRTRRGLGESMCNTRMPCRPARPPALPPRLRPLCARARARVPPQAYGRELDEAYEWCLKYRQSRKEAELHQARAAL